MQLSTKSVSAGDVLRSTYQTSGLFGFYRGLPSMVYFAAPKAAIRFSGFEACSGLLTGPDGSDVYKLGKLKGFIAGLGAGTLEAIFVTTPQETIKVRLIDDAFRPEGPRYNSFFHGVKSIVAEQGLAGVYKGLFPTIVKVSTAQATRFGVFNFISPEMVRYQFIMSSSCPTVPVFNASLTVLIFCIVTRCQRDTPIKAAASGAFAGGVSVLLFQGIDVVKSRMQGLEASKYRSTMHCVQEIIKNEGPMAFYKGVGPRLTRVCCEVGITMSLYGEIVKVLDKFWKTDP